MPVIEKKFVRFLRVNLVDLHLDVARKVFDTVAVQIARKPRFTMYFLAIQFELPLLWFVRYTGPVWSVLALPSCDGLLLLCNSGAD